MKLLHVSFRISKIIKLSSANTCRTEEKMSDNYCTSNIRLNSRPSNQNHIYGVHPDESIISCLYDIISRREHILCLYILHYIESGIIICSKKLYTVQQFEIYSRLLCLKNKINTSSLSENQRLRYTDNFNTGYSNSQFSHLASRL